MLRPIKILVPALILAPFAALPAGAAAFSARRGLNLDLGMTRPDESAWGDPTVMLIAAAAALTAADTVR